MRPSMILGVVLLLAGPARAAHLSGYYSVIQTPYLSGPQSYCLKLVSSGASGIYADQGSAVMLSTSGSQKHYQYLGQYQLYKKYISLVLGNYGQSSKYWFLMTANFEEHRWMDGLFYNYNGYKKENKENNGLFNGTFTATPVKGSCK